MNKRQLLSTVLVVAPLALAGCSDGGNFMAEGVDSSDSAYVASASHEMGVFHFSSGNFGLAVQHFQSATATDPRSVEAWNGLAATYDKLGRFDLAERYYKRALVVDPQSAQTLNNLGFSYWLQGRYDLAMAHLREADALDGGNRVIAANHKIAIQSYLAQRGSSKKQKNVAEATEEIPLLSARPTFSGPTVERIAKDQHRLITRADTVETRQPSPKEAVAAPDSVLKGLAYAPSHRGTAPDVKAAAVPRPLPAMKIDSAELTETLMPALPPRRVTFAVLDEHPGKRQSAKADQSGTTSTASDASEENLHDAWEAPFSLTGMLEASITDIQLAETHVPIPVTVQPVDQVSRALASNNLRIGARSTVMDSTVTHLALEDRTQFSAAATSLPVIELSNGVGRDGMAARLGGYLADRGLPAKRLTNAQAFDRDETTIYYSEGWRVYAMGLASLLPTDVSLVSFADERSDIRIEIGRDLLLFDGDLMAVRSVDDDSSG